MRTAKRSKHGGRLQIPNRFSGRSGIQYTGVFPQPNLGGRQIKAKPEQALNTLQQQQQQQLQQQQQFLAQQRQQQQQQQQQQQLQTVGNMPSYADQMQAAFLDYQRQRLEFEQQQQQLLQKLYTYYPDVSIGQQSQSQSQQPQSNVFGQRQSSNLFGGNNGLQLHQRHAVPQQQQQQQQQSQLPELQSQTQSATGRQQPNYYSTLQHMGFLQQQQQDILREQQQNVAQQFATGQNAPTTSQSYGMAIPESSVLGSPSYQPSSAVSHVRYSSGNLNYSF